MSTYLGRIGPLQAGSFAFRQRYLAIYDDALVFVRLNPWENADPDTALLMTDNVLAAGIMVVFDVLAAIGGTRRNKAVVRELGPHALARRHPENWVAWADDIQHVAVFRAYDVANSRRIRVRTPGITRELRYTYACGPDERVRAMLRQVVGTRFQLADDHHQGGP